MKIINEAKPDEDATITDSVKSDEDATITDSVKSDEDATITDGVKSDEDATITDSVKSDEDATITDSVKSDENNQKKTTSNVKKCNTTFKKPTLSLTLSVIALLLSIAAISKSDAEPDTGKLSYLYSELSQLKQSTSKVADIDRELLRLNIERSIYLLPESEKPSLNKMLSILSNDSTETGHANEESISLESSANLNAETDLSKHL